MWTSGSFTTILSQSFKRLTGTVNDGTVSDLEKNPSMPLIVTVQVNRKFVNAMIDTGSARSIIHINTLHKLIHRPRIKYQNNAHRTANNSELCTIGLVRLVVNIKKVFQHLFWLKSPLIYALD